VKVVNVRATARKGTAPHAVNLITRPPLRRRGMPFWKKEEKKPAPPPPKKPEGKPAAKPPAKAPPTAPPAAPAAPAATPEEAAKGVHKALVEAGLTIEGTREVFKKRLAEKFGSLEDFQRKMKEEPQASVTGFVTSWLGFTVYEKFDLADLLYNANQRLSSFGIQVDATDEVSVDGAQGLREATFTLGDRQTVLRFRNPREVFNEVNGMIRDRGVRFIELETWAESYAFMLVKSPKWESLARGELVIVKAEETATGGECPECGSRVGERWVTCIACNSPLKT
jgi:hypothetical protein